MFSKKATKIDKILTLNLTQMMILSIFVAFLENMNVAFLENMNFIRVYKGTPCCGLFFEKTILAKMG